MMKSVLTLVSGREDRVLRRIRISEIVRNHNQPRRYFVFVVFVLFVVCFCLFGVFF